MKHVEGDGGILSSENWINKFSYRRFNLCIQAYFLSNKHINNSIAQKAEILAVGVVLWVIEKYIAPVPPIKTLKTYKPTQ